MCLRIAKVYEDTIAQVFGDEATEALHGLRDAFGVVLDSASMRWAAAEGMPEMVIAGVLLLHEGSVDEIAAKLVPANWSRSSSSSGGVQAAIRLERSTPSKAGDKPGRRSTSRALRPMWHPVGPLRGSCPTLSTCAEPPSAGLQGSASVPPDRF